MIAYILNLLVYDGCRFVLFPWALCNIKDSDEWKNLIENHPWIDSLSLVGVIAMFIFNVQAAHGVHNKPLKLYAEAKEVNVKIYSNHIVLTFIVIIIIII